MKAIKLLLMSGCLAILLAGCTNVSQTDAIKLAKEAGAKIPSPPRIYNQYIYNPPYSDTADLRLWPDEPGSRQTYYNVCGAEPEPSMVAACNHPMTLTTALASSNSGQDVTFTISWPSDHPSYHSWLFHVDDSTGNFIKEEGDKLPQMPR